MPSDIAGIADVVELVIKAALAPVAARLKALEGQIGQPGPPGPPGADGLGFDAYTVDYDGERTFTHRWQVGETSAERTFKTPLAIYRGVYLDGKIYERGDMVTVNGSIYHCDTDTTTRPGDGSKDWTLAVKRGKDDRWRK
jgi:hypothetical protein